MRIAQGGRHLVFRSGCTFQGGNHPEHMQVGAERACELLGGQQCLPRGALSVKRHEEPSRPPPQRRSRQNRRSGG